jgi:hypothetical protein
MKIKWMFTGKLHMILPYQMKSEPILITVLIGSFTKY